MPRLAGSAIRYGALTLLPELPGWIRGIWDGKDGTDGTDGTDGRLSTNIEDTLHQYPTLCLSTHLQLASFLCPYTSLPLHPLLVSLTRPSHHHMLRTLSHVPKVCSPHGNIQYAFLLCCPSQTRPVVYPGYRIFPIPNARACMAGMNTSHQSAGNSARRRANE
jgi:hypothetical protein